VGFCWCTVDSASRHPGATRARADSRAPQRGQGDTCQGEEIRAAISTVPEPLPLAVRRSTQTGGARKPLVDAQATTSGGVLPKHGKRGSRRRWRGGTGRANFSSPGGKEHGAQRSVPGPWKRSFCASGQDRNGTVSCRSQRKVCPAARGSFIKDLTDASRGFHRNRAAARRFA
jgi:hypothetical protein